MLSVAQEICRRHKPLSRLEIARRSAVCHGGPNPTGAKNVIAALKD